MEDQEPTLRVRINQIDYIVNQAGPLDNTGLVRAPVIRIYGDSSIGKKTCLHVHQVYPYIFVEYQGRLDPDSGESLSPITFQRMLLTGAHSKPPCRETHAFSEPCNSHFDEAEPQLTQ